MPPLEPELGCCQRNGCRQTAVAFNDDGEAVCEDCLFQEACDG